MCPSTSQPENHENHENRTDHALFGDRPGPLWTMCDSQVVSAIQAWLQRELYQYALAARALAYSLPNGVGERELLQFSDRLRIAAREDLGRAFAAVGLANPRGLDRCIAREERSIEGIRAVIPEWPDTNGVPWRMCRTCHLVYDPTTRHHHKNAKPSSPGPVSPAL